LSYASITRHHTHPARKPQLFFPASCGFRWKAAETNEVRTLTPLSARQRRSHGTSRTPWRRSGRPDGRTSNTACRGTAS